MSSDTETAPDASAAAAAGLTDCAEPAPSDTDLLDVSIVIPVYNEDDGITLCNQELTRVLDAAGLAYELIYVDDGSQDESLALLKTFVRPDGRIVVIQLRRNQGQQKALWVGLQQVRGRVVITYDSDLQFVPECIPDLVAKVNEGVDIASGIRKARKDPLFANRLPSWAGQFLINRALGIKQKDFGSVKAYSRKLARDLADRTDPYLILPAAAYHLSKNFAEVEVGHQARQAGVTKWSLLRRMEFYLNIYTSYAQRPFEWMMVFGGISLGLSVALAFAILAYRIFVSADFRGTIVFFDVFLFATGLQLFCFAIIGEFILRIFRGRVMDPNAQLVEARFSQPSVPAPSEPQPPAADDPAA
ncbi:glycosyltransferase family 2 protein [Planctomycetota bacterium]|nr:glycosyltransferase family 2 protein [Planctomycetota bacterium]